MLPRTCTGQNYKSCNTPLHFYEAPFSSSLNVREICVTTLYFGLYPVIYDTLSIPRIITRCTAFTTRKVLEVFNGDKLTVLIFYFKCNSSCNLVKYKNGKVEITPPWCRRVIERVLEWHSVYSGISCSDNRLQFECSSCSPTLIRILALVCVCIDFLRVYVRLVCRLED